MLDLDLSPLFRGSRRADAGRPVGILTVCTGNICRSPLAEQALRHRLGSLGVTVSSAGTHALIDQPMAPDAARIAASFDVPADDSLAHRARWLQETHLTAPDLVLAMTREHRSHVVGLAPARTRSTFTVREFERLARGVTDDEISAAAAASGDDPHARMRAALALLTARRGALPPPLDPSDDDVIDPYRRPWEVYQESAAQLRPGLDEVVRIVTAALR